MRCELVLTLRVVRPVKCLRWAFNRHTTLLIWSTGINIAQILPVNLILQAYSKYRVHLVLRVLRVLQYLYWLPKYCEYGEYEQYRNPSISSTRSTKIRNTWSTQEYQEYWTRKYSEYSQNILPKYCQYSEYFSCPPSQSVLLQLPTGGTIRECFLEQNGDSTIEMVHRWSKYTGHIESVGVLRVLAELAVSTDEYCQ